MYSKNIKTSKSHRLLLNLADKIDLMRSDKYVALSNVSLYCAWKNIKESYKSIKFNIFGPTWNKNLKYQMGNILYQTFKIILSISSKRTKQ